MSDEGPRIAYITQHYPPETSGNASRAHDMAKHMANHGAEVTVLAPPPSFPYGSWERDWSRKREREDDGVHVVNLGTWQPTSEEPGFISRMAYFLTFPLHALLWLVANRGSYDCIVTSSPPLFTGIPGLTLKTLTKDVTLVTEVRDLWIDAAVDLGFTKEDSLATRLSRRLAKALYEKSDLIGVTTEDVKRKLEARYRLNGTPIVHVPNGVDTHIFEPDGAPRDPPTFVYAGNIGPAQDLETIVEAMPFVLNEHPTARLVLAGDGETRPALETRVRALGLEENVTFLGRIPRDEIPGLYARSIAGLAPLKPRDSLEYAVPTKAYECMACARPFVAMGIGEVRRLAKESNGGIIAENTPEDVAHVFNQLITDAKKSETLGHAGRGFVEEHYDREAIAASLVESIQEVNPA